MAEPKTKATKQSVASFIKSLASPQTREDCVTITKLMKDATGAEPQMWGSSIVGFGTGIIKYAGGREGEWPLIAFSPRKQNLVLYSMSRSEAELLKKLGKHSVGKGCLYIKRLSDIDLPTLKKLIEASVKRKKKTA